MYRDTTNVEPEMYDYTSNNWSHWNSSEKFKEKFGIFSRKTFNRFITKDSCTWNITLNMESTAVWSLKPERWGSPLVQEKYQEEKACDKTHPYNNNNNNNNNFIIRCCEHLNLIQPREHDDILALFFLPKLLGYDDGVNHIYTVCYCWTLSLV